MPTILRSACFAAGVDVGADQPVEPVAVAVGSGVGGAGLADFAADGVGRSDADVIRLHPGLVRNAVVGDAVVDDRGLDDRGVVAGRIGRATAAA